MDHVSTIEIAPSEGNVVRSASPRPNVVVLIADSDQFGCELLTGALNRCRHYHCHVAASALDCEEVLARINQAYLPVKRPRLGQLLMRAGVLTSKQLAHGLAEQVKRPQKLGMVLQDLGYLSQDILEERIREQARLWAPLWEQAKKGLE